MALVSDLVPGLYREEWPCEIPHLVAASELSGSAVDTSCLIHLTGSGGLNNSESAESIVPSSMRASPACQEPCSDHPRTRKGHKKSRGGCFNCKRRKIKCQENRPACHNCMRIKVPCTYPLPHIPKPIQKPFSPLLETRSLQSTPTVFNASDMRLFYHFIINAYPHLPLGNENVWVREIASFSHSYDFLLQAMLSLSASHLTVTSTSPLYSSALTYRGLAISGLNIALSTPPKSKADADAILATCWILTAVTMYMGESVEEFFSMMRGISLVLSQNWGSKYGTSFLNLTGGDQEVVITSRLKDFPLLPAHLVAEAKESVARLSGLTMQGMEREMCKLQAEIIRLLSVSSLEAYLKYREVHSLISSFSHAEFQAFIHPSNAIAQIILAHYVALLALMAPIKSREWAGRNMGTPNRHTVFKLDGIWNNVPEEMKGFLYWPMKATGSIPGILPYLKIMYSSEEEGLF
ncbi:hypothetical protein N431DRAFT_550919 [Stipitochalara longipes BDJ]|nr:hypothetical protein N431DRAFT_550919 [Stipitochalara longipes BDJ]